MSHNLTEHSFLATPARRKKTFKIHTEKKRQEPAGHTSSLWCLSSLTRKLMALACYPFLLALLLCPKSAITCDSKLIWSQVMETHLKPTRNLHSLKESEDRVGS